MFTKKILLAGSAVLLASWGISEAAAPDARDRSPTPFTVTSTTFKDGTMMPVKVSNVARQGAASNCVGQNVSPQLSWSRPPDGTKSFAITVVTPEGHAGLGFSDLVAYGIPANVNSFEEGELSKPSEKYIGGRSTDGSSTYAGPCGGPGSLFHYTFMVIATDLDPKELPPGLTVSELAARLEGHAKRAAGIVGSFMHP